jgi:toxin YoeB
MAKGAKLKAFVLLPQAEKDLTYWQKHNPKKLDRIRELIEASMIDPENGIGKPERLRYFKQETFSRRIDGQHRMIYSVEGDRLIIKLLRFHYQK